MDVVAKRGVGALGIPPALPRGGRGLLATDAGAVLCELLPLGVDADGARYELRVTNGTPRTLTANASALCLGETRPVAALAIEIAPHAAVRTGFTLDASLAYERVFAEVLGDGVHVVVEAPPPQGRRVRRGWVPRATVVGLAAILVAGTLGVVGAARPRVVDAMLVASPSGTLIAQWRTAGSGRPTYELRDGSGALLAHGPLPGAAGALAMGHGDAATLRVAIGNAFGNDAREAAYARATPPPAVRVIATPPPRIVSLAVDAARPGEPLTVRYDVRAQDLRLAIVDRAGRPWFTTTAPGGSGTLQVPMPPAGPNAPFALVATARRAGLNEATRVPLALLPEASPAPAPGTATALPADGAGAGAFAIRPARLQPGRPFVVEIPFADGARIAIVRSGDQAEVSSALLAPGERSAAFIAPPRGIYVVRVTLRRGAGEDVLMRSLVFAPA